MSMVDLIRVSFCFFKKGFTNQIISFFFSIIMMYLPRLIQLDPEFVIQCLKNPFLLLVGTYGKGRQSNMSQIAD